MGRAAVLILAGPGAAERARVPDGLDALATFEPAELLGRGLAGEPAVRQAFAAARA